MSVAPDESIPPLPARRLGAILRPYARPLLLGALLLVIQSGLGLLGPWLAGGVVDAALRSSSPTRLNQIVLWLMGLFALMGLFSYARIYLLDATSARLLLDLRARLFGHLVHLPPSFHETRRVGELLSRLGSDLTAVQQAVTMQVPSGLQAILGLFGTLTLLLFLHTKLTLMTLAVVPPVIALAVWTGSRLEKLATRVQDALADSQSVNEEALAGLRTVQAFAREDHELERQQSRLGLWLTLELRRELVGIFHGLLQFSAFTAFAGVLWYGGRLIQQGDLSPGDLTSFLLYTFSIAASVGTLGVLFTSYKELKGATARVFQILDTPSAIADPPEPVTLGRPTGRLTFERVHFQYPSAEGREALTDIDLTIEPGEMIALVGPSGAGKTTLFSLLLRFYDPASGRVLLDGHDLRSLRLIDLRQSIGLVPQDLFLFSASVEENLRYGRPDATFEQVVAAAVAAGADRFIRELPNQYPEMVGERGIKLSVGQRQRLAIARAFLKDPTILLLDEATSALDAESEEIIQQALTILQKGRTTLVIAHRLATRRANRILVMEHGRIIASGTHKTLIESSTLYRRYWELQSLRDASGGQDFP